MNRLIQAIASLFISNRATPVDAARALLERSTNARGQSAYEAAMLRANAQAVLSVLR
jgi:hypothetical protein